MNLDPKDIDAINQMVKKLDEPHADAPCPCPVCRYLRGDLPPFTGHDVGLINIIANDILKSVRRRPPVTLRASLHLMQMLLKLAKTAYAAGVDNARREMEDDQ